MKSTLLLLFAFGLFGWPSMQIWAQSSSFDTDFQKIDQELAKWDPVRGTWLSASLKAMASGEAIPDRTFPEDYSPGEMLMLIPAPTIERLQASVNERQSNPPRRAEDTRTNPDLEKWNRVQDFLRRRACAPVMGRSYGDPHLKSFDNEGYSFQTVGEFIMSKSTNGQFEIQCRQEPRGTDVSLNTAAAMNVGGDRVAIYANGTPDVFSNTPLRVNGAPIEIEGRTYYLPHGGTIKKSKREYMVTWPTGEKATFDLQGMGSNGFMNIAVQVYPCASNGYRGLLGNANGVRHDDFNTRGGNVASDLFGNEGLGEDMERRRLAFLAKDFANEWRISQEQSLFDYRFGENTLSYTDLDFPRVHRTINDLPRDRRDQARRECQQRGFTGRDLEACIYDRGFVDIPPTPHPVIASNPRDVVLPPVVNPTPNVNSRSTVVSEPPRQSGDTPVIGTRKVENGDVKQSPAPSTPNDTKCKPADERKGY